MPEQRYQEQQASSPYHPQSGLSVTTRPRILTRTRSSPNATAKHADDQELWQQQQQKQQQQQQPWQGSLITAAPHTGLGIDAETRSNGFLQTNKDSYQDVPVFLSES
jgi:hypothetical protein